MAVVIPVRNDAAGLPRSVAAVLAQDYPGELTVCLGVGPSGDGTEAVAADLAARHANVLAVPNPSGATAAGLNAAIRATRSEVVARVDGHCELSPGYLTTAVEALASSGAANVGGLQDAVGETSFERTVAAAMTSAVGTGGARFHTGGAAGPVDTVYLGVFRRDALERVGLFDERLVRNQDYELNIRLRAAGEVVWFDPRLRVTYRPRPSLRRLARQYFEYGRWKRAVLTLHPRSLKLRQAAPAAVSAAVGGGLALALVARWRRALLTPFGYLAALALAAPRVDREHPWRAAAVLATMHLAWGAGFLTARPAAMLGERTRPEGSAAAQPQR